MSSQRPELYLQFGLKITGVAIAIVAGLFAAVHHLRKFNQPAIGGQFVPQHGPIIQRFIKRVSSGMQPKRPANAVERRQLVGVHEPMRLQLACRVLPLLF